MAWAVLIPKMGCAPSAPLKAWRQSAARAPLVVKAPLSVVTLFCDVVRVVCCVQLPKATSVIVDAAVPGTQSVRVCGRGETTP